MQKEVRVDGITITGMSRSQAREAILAEFPWSMTVTYGEDTYQVTDLMAAKVDALLDEIYSGEPEEDYTLDTTGLEEQAAAEAAAAQPNGTRRPRTVLSAALTRRRTSSYLQERRTALPLIRRSWLLISWQQWRKRILTLP